MQFKALIPPPTHKASYACHVDDLQVGDLTLSVRYQDRVRHFPIQMTASGKYDIGKAHFTDLIKVVDYYQHNPIFFDENDNNAPVALGRPINQPRTPH